MSRKKRKIRQHVDEQLLLIIYQLQWDWKETESIVEQSIEPSDDFIYKNKLVKAKYLFLLREARRRNLSADQYQ